MIPAGTISEILTPKGSMVLTVPPEATVFEAIQKMAEKNIGALLVTDKETLVGIISERDYTRKVALKGKSSKELKVREIVSNPVTVTPKHSIEDCMRLMTEHRVRHLPVLEGEKIVGVVSIGDLVNWIISAQSTAIKQLETYISVYPTCGDCSVGAVRRPVEPQARHYKLRYRSRLRVRLTETNFACGMTNFFTSTVTACGLNFVRTRSAVSAASFSSSFQVRCSPNFNNSCATWK
jgi:CBS domain-containing protein